MLEKYNERFVELIGEMQGLTSKLGDDEVSLINSTLHDFDRDVRKIIENGELRK